MMKQLKTLALAIACATSCLSHAADNPAPATPAAPPAQWDRALSVTVVIGGDIPAGTDALLSPTPLLLRVDDPKRLRDAGSKSAECVIDADAVGNLASERIMVRPLAIRCFDAEGSQTVSKLIKGYLVDKDARAGAKGVISWSQSAKDLLLLGTGSESRKNIVMRSAQQALSHATMGIGDDILVQKDEHNGPSSEIQQALRSEDTLLPALTLEPGRNLHIVILSGVQ